MDVVLKRETIQVPTVSGYARGEGFEWNYFIDEGDKIAYLRLSGFGRNTARELRDALREIINQDAKGLVIDLRFNPGGLLSQAIQVSDLFVSQGRIVSTKGRNIRERKWDARKRGTYEDLPMAILINRFSASASEIVSACLQDHDRAVIIGERSWGKGSVQNIIELEQGGSALKLTTASYHRPSGKNIHRAPNAKESDEWGVSPSDGFEVKLNGREAEQLRNWIRNSGLGQQANAIKDFRDRQMEKAVAHLHSVLQPAPTDDGTVPPEPKITSPSTDTKVTADVP